MAVDLEAGELHRLFHQMVKTPGTTKPSSIDLTLTAIVGFRFKGLGGETVRNRHTPVKTDMFCFALLNLRMKGVIKCFETLPRILHRKSGRHESEPQREGLHVAAQSDSRVRGCANKRCPAGDTAVRNNGPPKEGCLRNQAASGKAESLELM
ncbi:hypothetical protein PG997_004764 [Apiospora hydei]|uniref:Uncharacterized protein n=1 Tax=Apiospora hydei TaxID=1337664 RepID=A0ABR1X308_9PEZI